MDSFIHADIFFFVTTIAVVVFFVFLSVVLFYLARILRKANDVIDTVQYHVKDIVRDVNDFRERARPKTNTAADMIRSFREMIGWGVIGKETKGRKEKKKQKRKHGKK